MKWRVNLQYNAGTNFYVWSHSGDHGSLFTEVGYGLVKSVEPIESGVDPVNCSFQVPSVVVRLTDCELGGTLASGLTDKTLSGYLLGKNFRNRKVQIWRITDSMTSVSSHDEEFLGIIADYYYDNLNKEWVFECVGNSVKYEKQLPEETVNTTDYPNAPRTSLGMPIPFVYGSFVLQSQDAVHNLWHLAPTVCIDKIAGSFAISSHTLDSLSTGQQYVFLPGLGVYGGALIAQDGATLPTITNSTTSLVTLPVAEYFMLTGLYLTPAMKGSINTVGTIDNIVDDDVSTTVALTTDYYARFPSLQGDGEFLKDATSAQMYFQIAVVANVTAYSGANTSKLVMYNPDTGTAYGPVSMAFNTTGFKTSTDIGGLNGIGIATNRTDNTASGTAWAGGATTPWTWEEIARYEYGIDVGASATCTISVLAILVSNLIVSGQSLDLYAPNMPRVRGVRSASQRVGRRRQARDPYRVNANEYYPFPTKGYSNQSGAYGFSGFSALFTQCGGIEFGSWIDEVGRTNSYSAGQRIVLSNGVIESILRDKLTVPAAEIDVTSFDTAETGAYEFTFSQNEFVSSMELIQELSFFSRCITTCKSDGTWEIFRFADTPAASDATLIPQDVQILEVSTVDSGAMINDLTIAYHYDYGKQQYTQDTKDENTTSKGSTSDGINRNAITTLECPFIRKVSSGTNYAPYILDFLLAQWKDPHRQIVFEVLNLAYMGLEELDVVEFANFTDNIAGIGTGAATDYWSSFTAPATKYWLITKRISEVDKVTLTAMQLHDL